MTEPRPEETRGRGRPRSARVDRAVREATLAELAAVGFGALSIEGVAARAGVAKSTVYRRYGGRLELVLSAMSSLVLERPAPDTGALRSDLLRVLEDVAEIIGSPVMLQVTAGLVGEMQVNAELAGAFREMVMGRRVQVMGEVFARAARRGEVAADLDWYLYAQMLVGPVFLRLLLSGEPVDAVVVERLVDAVLRAIATARTWDSVREDPSAGPGRAGTAGASGEALRRDEEEMRRLLGE